MFGQGSKLLNIKEYPSAETLKAQWKEVIKKNDTILSEFPEDELDQPHCLLTEDPEKDFFKTKGRCIMIWALHQMYHNGQLTVLKKK